METTTVDSARIVLATNPTRLLVFAGATRVATIHENEMIVFHVPIDAQGIALIQQIDDLFDVLVESLSIAATCSDN